MSLQSVDATHKQTEVKKSGDPTPGGAHTHYVVERKIDHGVLGELKFQEGDIKDHGVNGLMIENLIAIAIDRLKGFQTGPDAHDKNDEAIDSLEEALSSLQERTEEVEEEETKKKQEEEDKKQEDEDALREQEKDGEEDSNEKRNENDETSKKSKSKKPRK